MKSSQGVFFYKNCLSLAQNNYHWLVEQTNSWQHQQNFCLKSVLLQFTKMRFVLIHQEGNLKSTGAGAAGREEVWPG